MQSEAYLRFPISRECEALVIFSGVVTQEAIEKLILILETSRDAYPTRAEAGLAQHQQPASRPTVETGGGVGVSIPQSEAI